MNNNFNFNNGLNQTGLNDAYKFNTFSDFINNNKTTFSPICIFCSSRESIPIVRDGSFRQCTKCKRQFKAKIN